MPEATEPQHLIDLWDAMSARMDFRTTPPEGIEICRAAYLTGARTLLDLLKRVSPFVLGDEIMAYGRLVVAQRSGARSVDLSKITVPHHLSDAWEGGGASPGQAAVRQNMYFSGARDCLAAVNNDKITAEMMDDP